MIIVGAVLIALVFFAIGYFSGRRVDDDPYELAPPPEHMPADSKTRARLSALLEASDTAVLVLDERDRVVLANNAAAVIFDAPLARIVEHALIEATGSAEIERRVLAARSGDTDRASCEITVGGTTRALDLRAITTGTECLVLIRDTTRLRESERIRREFLGNVSHELRTPLAGIKLMFETLVAVDSADARAYFFPQIDAEIDRLVEIVEHLLDVARAEGGRLALARDPIDLWHLTESALSTMRQRIAARAITLVTNFESAHIRGDVGRLSQVVTNLVENALRHTPPGGTLTIYTGIRNQRAILEVEDTGTGIPYKDLPHIFERFYVGERSRAKDAGGLGLGLALVKGTVEGLDGTIEVASELGAGARFTAAFPISIPA